MFRVKENPDGSVSIFLNDENRSFVCSVDTKTSSRLRVTKLNNITPSKKNKDCNTSNGRVPTSPKYLVPKLSPGFSGKRADSTRERLPRTRKLDLVDYDDASSVSSFSSVASTFSLASTISVESSEEPDNDCMDQWSYGRMLNLVNSKKLHTASEDMAQELRRSFPIRRISCQCVWQDPKKLLPKRTDQVEMSSILGKNILRAHPRPPNSDSPENSISKYERFCKSSGLNMQPLAWQQPVLRTREVRTRYSVTYKRRPSSYTHQYMFSKKQRRHRYEQLKLGLSHRSYMLKRTCKKLSVPIQRLSSETIYKYCNPLKKGSARNQPVQKTLQGEHLIVQKVNVPNGFFRPSIDTHPVTSMLRMVAAKVCNTFSKF